MDKKTPELSDVRIVAKAGSAGSTIPAGGSHSNGSHSASGSSANGASPNGATPHSHPQRTPVQPGRRQQAPSTGRKMASKP